MMILIPIVDLQTKMAEVSTNSSQTETTFGNWTSTASPYIDDFSGGFNARRLIMFPFGLLVLMFNSMALLSLSRCRSVDKRVRVLTQCMCVTDIIFWCSLVITVCVNSFPVRNIPVVCSIIVSLVRSCVLINICMVTVLALDRSMCVQFPFKYIQFVTKRRVIRLFLVICLTSIILPIFSIPSKLENCATLSRAEGNGVIFIAFILCAVIITIAYISICKNIRKQIRQIQTTTVQAPVSKRNMYRSTISFSIIILTFMVCYSPICIERAIIYFNPNMYDHNSALKIIINTVYACHSLINPFIYAWMFRECRLHMLKLLYTWNAKKKAYIENQIKQLNAPFLV